MSKNTIKIFVFLILKYEVFNTQCSKSKVILSFLLKMEMFELDLDFIEDLLLQDIESSPIIEQQQAELTELQMRYTLLERELRELDELHELNNQLSHLQARQLELTSKLFPTNNIDSSNHASLSTEQPHTDVGLTNELSEHSMTYSEASSSSTVHSNTYLEASNAITDYSTTYIDASTVITDHSTAYIDASSSITDHSTTYSESSSAITDHSTAFIVASSSITDHSTSYIALPTALTYHSPTYNADAAASPEHAPATIEDATAIIDHSPMYNNNSSTSTDNSSEQSDEPIFIGSVEPSFLSKTNKKRGRKKEFFEVEKIVWMKEVEGKVFYEIKWLNFSDSFNEWIDEKDMLCPALVKKFKK